MKSKFFCIFVAATIVLNSVSGLAELANISYIPFFIISSLSIIKTEKIKVPFELVWLILFVIMIAFTSIIGNGYIRGCFSIMSLVLMVILAYCTLNKSNVKVIVKYIIVSTCFLSLLSLLANIGSSERLGTGVSNSINLGIALSLCTIFFSYMLNTRGRIRYLLCLIGNFILIFYTQARAAIIISILLYVICFIFTRKEKNLKLKLKQSLIIILALIATIYLGYKTGFLSQYTRRFEGLTEAIFSRKEGQGSVYFRVQVKKLGFQSFLAKPLFGHGLGASRIFLRSTYFHDNYVQLLYETGILGLGTYLLANIIVLLKAIKKKNLMSALLIVFILSYGVFDVTYGNKVFYIVFSIAILLLKSKSAG